MQNEPYTGLSVAMLQPTPGGVGTDDGTATFLLLFFLFLNDGDPYWERRTVRYRDSENLDSNSKTLFYKDCSSERYFELKSTSPFGPWSHASRNLACLAQTRTQNEG